MFSENNAFLGTFWFKVLLKTCYCKSVLVLQLALLLFHFNYKVFFLCRKTISIPLSTYWRREKVLWRSFELAQTVSCRWRCNLRFIDCTEKHLKHTKLLLQGIVFLWVVYKRRSHKITKNDPLPLSALCHPLLICLSVHQCRSVALVGTARLFVRVSLSTPAPNSYHCRVVP